MFGNYRYEGEQPIPKMHHMGAFFLFGCKYRHIVHAGVQREAERLCTIYYNGAVPRLTRGPLTVRISSILSELIPHYI